MVRIIALAVAILLVSTQVRAASFDCSKAAHPVEKAICTTPALSEKDDLLGRQYRERLAALTASEQDILRTGQREWSAMVRKLCTSGDKGCVGEWLDVRLRDLRNSGLQVGPFRFLSVDHYKAQPVSEEAPWRESMPYVSSARSYPQIAAAHSDGQRWNALIQEAFGRYESEADADDAQGFTVSLASPRIISIRFETYLYPHGAAHGSGGSFGHTVLLASGRKLAASDLFRPDTPWRDALAGIALADLRRQAQAEDTPLFPEAAKAVGETVPDPDNWLLTPQGLVLVFQPYVVGPYSFGVREVAVPWAELSRFLVAGAPVP